VRDCPDTYTDLSKARSKVTEVKVLEIRTVYVGLHPQCKIHRRTRRRGSSGADLKAGIS